ncbi:hypothetical protein RhiirB3_443888 [Rhizophagus irregularis]|nr:hypothetical protein RhiirB3_443888 [Rhizophagus irregularis]
MHGISYNPNKNEYTIVLQDGNCEECGKKYVDVKTYLFGDDYDDYAKDKIHGISQNPSTKITQTSAKQCSKR